MENLYPKLKFMLDLTSNPDLIASLLEQSGLFSIHHVRWFASPIVMHRSPWADTVPPWLKKAVYFDRLEQVFREHDQGTVETLATPTEVLACIYPASMDAPLDHDIYNLYLYVGNDVMIRHDRIPEGQSFWDVTGATPVDYERVRYDYQRIAFDIRRKAVQAGKKAGWCARKTKAE